MNCRNCSKPLEGPYTKVFCSLSCSAIHRNKNRTLTKESREKISKSLLGKKHPKRKSKDPVTHITRKVCVICNSGFWAAGPNRKRIVTCGKECASTNRSMNRNRKTQIPFIETITGKTIHLQSSWEVKTAKKLDELKIRWARPSKRIKWNDGERDRTYLPDFYLPDYDLYLDVKNHIGISQQKIKIEECSKIINLVVLELQPMIEYLEALSRLELDLRRSKRPV